jgi:hypothetical protein
MPRIFDNIDKQLLPALQQTLGAADRADFCVGYFNLRGWQGLADHVERWPGGDGHCCRLLVGMHVSPNEELLQVLSAGEFPLDNQAAVKAKQRMAEDFRRQLTFGTPTNADEAVLRRLSAQISSRKLFVKVYLRHSLHAKLYLSYRQDANNPVTGFLGSSNLTLAGLSKQGELNVDVLEHDACDKLARWFEDRWKDRWCIDISKELACIIDESWAGDRLVPPYHVYLKMAWHLAREARAGLSEFRIPSVFGNMTHRDILPSAWRTTAADAMDPISHIQSRSWPMISTCHRSYNMARFTSQHGDQAKLRPGHNKKGFSHKSDNYPHL